MRAVRRGFGGRRGYSLTEMLVVLGIIGMILAIGFPEMSKMIRKAKLEEGVGTMEAVLRVTREKALTRRTHYRVTLLPTESRFVIAYVDTGGVWTADADSVFRFPPGIGFMGTANATTFGSGGGADLIFEPRGTLSFACSPLNVTFFDDRGDTMRLEMVRTGRVRSWH